MRNNFFLFPCIIFIFWLYSPALSQDFYMLDDVVYVVMNDSVKNGVSFDSIFWAFTTKFYGNWAPVTWISHMLDVELFSMQACYHHLTSILLHISNFVLLFIFLANITKKKSLALFVSFLFAIHPISLESVVWISSRKELLATFFGLLTLNCYLKSQSGIKQRYYYFALTFYFLALASKVSAVNLIFVIALIDYLPLKKITYKAIPFIVLSIAVFYVNLVAQQADNTKIIYLSRTVLQAGFFAIEHVYQYIKIVFLPGVEYSNLYPQEEVGYQHNWYVIILVPILFSAIIFFFLRTKKYLELLGLLWFFAAVFIYLQFFPVGKQAVAYRWIYQAQIGIYLVLGSYFFKIKNFKLMFSSLLLITCTLSFINRSEITYYSDVRKNTERVINLYPDNRNAIGYYLNFFMFSERIEDLNKYIFKTFVEKDLIIGDFIELVKNRKRDLPIEVQKKIQKIESFTKVPPEDSLIKAEIIHKYYLNSGLDKKKIIFAYVDSALEQKPDYFRAMLMKGAYFLYYHDYQNADLWLAKAYEKNPKNIDLLNILGQYYQETGNLDKAIEFYKKTIEHNPFSTGRSSLAKIYDLQKKYQESCDIIEPKIKNTYATDSDYLIFAKCQYNLGNEKLSLKLLDFVISRDTKNIEALKNYIIISTKLKACEQANIKFDILRKINQEQSTMVEKYLQECKSH